jgi:hypothetical protein
MLKRLVAVETEAATKETTCVGSGGGSQSGDNRWRLGRRLLGSDEGKPLGGSGGGERPRQIVFVFYSAYNR